MNQLNSLIIEGNVTKEPEFKETANGYKVCNIPIAVNRFYKNSEDQGVNEVSYFTIETFGKMAEVCHEKCKKGRGIRVVGRIKQNRWTNADGKATSRVSIVAEHVEFKKFLTTEETEAQPAEKPDMEAMKEANQAAYSAEIAEKIPEEAVVF